MSKLRRRGRDSKDGKHVRDYEWKLQSPAYRSLDCVQRCLLQELMRLYKGGNNGELYLSVRSAAALLGVNKDTAARAFKFLENRGFIRARQKGSFGWKTDAGQTAGGPATTWILTEFEFAGQLATKNFMASRGRRSQSKIKNAVRNEGTSCPLKPDSITPKRAILWRTVRLK